MGKKVKETPFPSVSPSMNPSSVPTSMPSDTPSLVPTATPVTTSTPSSIPTRTVTNSPTGKPTTSPTDYPTAEPSHPPTGPPTSTQTTEYVVSDVQLPRISVDLILSDEDAGSDVLTELDSELTSFINTVLATHSGVDSFDYAKLDFNVILSVFNRRRLDTGLSINIDGTAYFGGQAPSKDDLSQGLLAYFSFWGVQDLEAALHILGLSSARIAAVSVDGNAVKEIKHDEQTGAQVQQKTPLIGEDSVLSPALIASMGAAFLVLVGAIAFILFQRRTSNSTDHPRSKKKSKRKAEQQQQQQQDNTHTGATSRPSQPSKTSSRGTSDDEESIVSGLISVDDSLYTTNTAQLQSRTPAYDPKRLDKVIAVARQRSSEKGYC